MNKIAQDIIIWFPLTSNDQKRTLWNGHMIISKKLRKKHVKNKAHIFSSLWISLKRPLNWFYLNKWIIDDAI